MHGEGDEQQRGPLPLTTRHGELNAELLPSSAKGAGLPPATHLVAGGGDGETREAADTPADWGPFCTSRSEVGGVRVADGQVRSAGTRRRTEPPPHTPHTTTFDFLYKKIGTHHK
jgi:hypothetical protein